MTIWSRRRFALLNVAGLWGCRSHTISNKPLLRVAVVPQPSMAGVYLAYESGYFRDRGLNVELVVFNAGTPQTIPLLSSDKFAVVFGGITPAVINARALGARFRIVAGREIVSRGCSDFGVIYGNRNAFPNGLTDVRQLKGKRIAVSLPTGTTYFALDVVLSSAGLSASDVNLAYLREPEAIATMRAGKIDAWVAQNQHDPKMNQVFSEFVSNPGLADFLPEHQYTFVYFGPRLLEGPVDAGGRFVAAYVKGAQEFLKGRTPRFLLDFARSSGIDPEQMKSQCRATFTPDGAIRTKSLEYYINWAHRRGFCKSTIPVAELVDTRFLDYARGLQSGANGKA